MNQPNQFNQLNTSQKPQPSFQPERPKRFSWPRWTSIFIAAVAVVVISLVSWAAYRAFISTPIELPSESPEEKQVSPLPAAGEITPADETAIWQTYRNEEYGFEVKYPYPDDFIIRKDEIWSSLYLTLQRRSPGNNYPESSIDYFTFESIQNKCLDNYSKEDRIGDICGYKYYEKNYTIDEINEYLDSVAKFFQDIGSGKITSEDILRLLQSRTLDLTGILTPLAPHGFGVANLIKIGDTNGVELYSWAAQDATPSMFSYQAILVKNRRIITYSFGLIEEDDKLYDTYSEEINKDVRKFTEGFFEKIRKGALEKNIQDRIDLGKEILSTFKFIE